MAKDLKHHLICPYCHRGEVLSDGKAPITVSARCPICKGFFLCNMDKPTNGEFIALLAEWTQAGILPQDAFTGTHSAAAMNAAGRKSFAD